MLRNYYIGFDRDGTLDLPGMDFPKKLSLQFSKLQELGAKLFLASGKDYKRLVTIAKQIHIEPWMICSENGGHIVTYEPQIDYVHKENNLDFQFFVNNLHKLKLPKYKEEHKISIWSKKFGENSLLAKNIIEEFIKTNELALHVYVHPDIDGGVDVVPLGIDKINCLSFIPKNAKIYYFGDAENDLGMMEHERVNANTVSNARDVIKESVLKKSGIISTLPASLGVSEILTRLFNV